jgi:hypothetical protein
MRIPNHLIGDKKAIVHYGDGDTLFIDLTIKEKKTYEVEGYYGIVKIEAVNGKVRVLEETSPLHLCSKQGYISETYESIICLPNKVIINIEADDELDTIIK